MYTGHLRNENRGLEKKLRLTIDRLQKLPSHKRGPLNKLDVTDFVLNSERSLKSLTKSHLRDATDYFFTSD